MQRHPLDAVSLVAGAIFAVAGMLLLVGRLDILAQARWVAPLLLIVIAIAILVSVSPRPRGRGDTKADSSDV
jgi:uncharacterized membrane protein (UPF0136 family)